MDNCTLKVLDMKGETVDILEEYRFVFLDYLENAKKLLFFEDEAKKISAMQRIWNYGRILEQTDEAALQRKQALDAERTLSHLYELDCSEDGFERAKCQFDAEFIVLKKQEQSLWDRLLSVVEQIYAENKYESTYQIWFDDEAEMQHALLTKDSEAYDRICFYQKRLRRFDEGPELPNALEITFTLNHGSLIRAVPFRV